MDRRKFLLATGAATIAANSTMVSGENRTDDPFNDVKKMISEKKPITWVFTGDSITHGALHTYGWRSYVEYFAERVRWEMKRMHDFVINTGISGDTLKGISADVDRRIFQFRPQVISLNIGMNDCREGDKGKAAFKQYLENLIEKAERQKSILLLQTPNLIDFLKSEERQPLPKYVEIIREIGAEYKLPLVDHYGYWVSQTANSSRLQFWLNDGAIHPNNFGHIVMAHKIFQDLGIFDPLSPTCKFFIP
jgi:lysophospholipase L1-like esterase